MDYKISREAIVVLGVYHSGSNVMAGILGELGCDEPADMQDVSESSSESLSESKAISLLNKDVLAAVGISRSGLGDLPIKSLQTLDDAHFSARANSALSEAYAGSELFIIKHHQSCSLISFWDSVLTQHKVRPSYICMFRDPNTVAALLTRESGFDLRYGQFLWLQYALESELQTRGKTRTFISYDHLYSDWKTQVSRISVDLSLTFPRSIKTAEMGVGELFSREMTRLSSEGLVAQESLESPEWMVVTWEVLNRWSQNGEDPADYVTLDHARNALNEASDTLSLMFKKLSACDSDLERLRRAHADASENAARLSAQLGEARITIANREASLAAGSDAFQDAWRRFQNLQKELSSRTKDLRNARVHPLKNIRTFLEFRALRILSSSRAPIPQPIKARFRGAAKNRSPFRNLPQMNDEVAKTNQEFESVRSRNGLVAFQPDFPSMIVVTHDASRTGAPILALSLARVFSNRYNVITVCLRGGDLIADFHKYSTEIHVAEHVVGSGAQYARLLDAIVAKKRPVFAVVNSIESRCILSSLRKHQIPSVALFHEFASYTLPKSAFKDAFLLADEIVFSTELTIENALQETSFVRTPRFHVLPQGRCEVPQSGGAEAMRQVERDRLAAFLRPDANQEDEFVVIGAGYVHIRKGVDLFIDVARRVAATDVGKKARFVWIGGGYDPERDPAYSVYLRDQIERAELTDRMMLGETSEIEHVYKLSNLLLLTSRLDPLPNVAIDAMSEGIPVICFDKTTGIADVLTDAGLRDACVADYLDTAEAAEKILRLIRSNDSYRRVCDRSKSYAARAFDFDGYATQIERWGLEAARLRSNQSEDASTIASSADFDPAFPRTRHRLASGKTEAAEYYLADGWRASAPSRPEPGFNPLIYSRHLEEGGVTGVDAYAEFLRRDRPTGPWLRSVIREHASSSIGKGRGPLRIALHIHANHPESIAAIAALLSLNETLPDLFINTGDRKGLDLAIESLKGYRGRIAEARVALNRGRDLGSLLTEFGDNLVGNYDLIGHVHTQADKKSLGHDRLQIRQEFLWENMLGGQSGGAMMDRIVTAFMENEHLGLVFPATREMFSWSNSGTNDRNLAKQLGITRLPEFVDFPIGSMFWVRAAALEPLVALGLGWNDYPPEPLEEDGTILQAIERLLGLVAESRGFDFAVTNVKGISI